MILVNHRILVCLYKYSNVPGEPQVISGNLPPG